jgi:hypothetical protein
MSKEDITPREHGARDRPRSDGGQLPKLITALDTGEAEKIVLTRRNQMRVVILSVERYAELEHHAST